MGVIKFKNLMVLLCVTLFMSHHSYAQNLWEAEINKEGIEVYSRIEKYSDFKSFKAVMTITASTDEILNLLRNADDYSKWYGYTKTSKLLKQEQDIQYNYVETIFPWPYRNRDMVYRMSVDTPNVGEVKISLKGIPDYIPKNKGKVRMTEAEGYVLLKSTGGNTELIYVFHSEPGANIPSWLANNSIATLPFQTLSGLRKILRKNRKVNISKQSNQPEN